MRWTIFLLSFIFLLTYHTSKPQSMSEPVLRDFLENVYEQFASAACTKLNRAEWNYATDIGNPQKEEYLLNTTLEEAAFDKDTWKRYFEDLNPDDYQDEFLQRQIKTLRNLGNAALDEDRLSELTTTVNTMTNIYSTAKICPYRNQNCNLETEGLSLEPGIQNIIAESHDYDELVYAWTSWRNVSGAQMKNLYPTYVSLSNEAARANKFSDKGELWRAAYEDDNFVSEIDALWSQVEPLYLELHKYTANKLKERYGNRIDYSDGLLPAHVFGNMWAQDWLSLSSLLKPYPYASEVDVDAALKEHGYTVRSMFETSDYFYQSLGLIPNDISYNTSAGAMIEKPNDGREVLCHASAWDFCDGRNYRIKMCTEVSFDYFTTVHHEMGHIQYFMQYKDQPIAFRTGANPGFHEAIGDTIALSVSTPQHLKKIGLLPNYEDDDEASINALMDMALQKIAFLPFGLLIDKWRWDVFAGDIPEERWNSHWWDYRAKYQKLKPPVSRSDATDFDPGAKFHVAGDSYYIAYFVAHILQFQFLKSLCIAAGEYDPQNPSIPLHKCDFYESIEAGDRLKAGLQLGASIHWSETLDIMTGGKKMDASALLEYFAPLYDFLRAENAKM